MVPAGAGIDQSAGVGGGRGHRGARGAPTVRGGLLERGDGGCIRFTESGRRRATQVVRNHRLWEAYLIHHADIAPTHVDRDADAIEHVLDADLIRSLESVLGTAAGAVPSSPHTIGGEGRA